MKKGPERMGIETSTRDLSPTRRGVHQWLCFGGRASDSGLYLKLVTRVYLIEKAAFRWYCLLKFLGHSGAEAALYRLAQKR
jgi:hypothetical protein